MAPVYNLTSCEVHGCRQLGQASRLKAKIGETWGLHPKILEVGNLCKMSEICYIVVAYNVPAECELWEFQLSAVMYTSFNIHITSCHVHLITRYEFTIERHGPHATQESTQGLQTIQEFPPPNLHYNTHRSGQNYRQ